MSQTKFIYLIHFDQPFKHAKHYIGSAVDLEHRLNEQDERRLKNRGGAARLCPICNPGTKAGRYIRGYRPRKHAEGAA